MRIVVNAQSFNSNTVNGYVLYCYQILSIVAAQQPQYFFYFLVDEKFIYNHNLPSNVIIVVVQPRVKCNLIGLYWYPIKVALFAKKIKANLIIQPFVYCSLTSSIPQITVIYDPAFLHNPKDNKQSQLLYYKIFSASIIKKSTHLVTVSQAIKQDIVNKYNTPNDSVSVIYNAADSIYKPLPWQQQRAVKEQYTDGKNYFICVSSMHPRKNLVTLLKAFSIFKKWQQSNMKLVLIGKLLGNNSAFEKLLNTYKHKADVVLLGHLSPSQLAPILGAAYVCVYPSLYEGFGLPIIEAMQCGVPVITSNNSSMQEAGGSAALYANPNSEQDIAQQMQLLYKDETLCQKHIILGLQQAKRYSWQASATAFAQLITTYTVMGGSTTN